jgi:AraC-like DNA-binding protein
MAELRNITLDRGWRIMLKALNIDPQNAVRRAGLSQDLLSQETVRLSVEEYFKLVEAVDGEVQDPTLALRMGQSASPEFFSPPIFAALCSPSLAIAANRMSVHKRLIAPMSLRVKDTHNGLSIAWEWDDPTVRSPWLLMAMELVFMTQIARIGTRETIRPTQVTCPAPFQAIKAYTDYFGVAPVVAERTSLTFSHADAHSAFLTASEAMWQTFEPALRRQLSKSEAQASISERIRSALLECLPSGEASIDGPAHRLGMSPRTLQRRLKEEGFAFRDILKDTREQLSRHYLLNTILPYSEIAFLIGFDEPSSFFRAFREWTGTTPESIRSAG